MTESQPTESGAPHASNGPELSPTANPAEILRNALLDLRIEMAVANRRIAAITGLRESDLDTLDVLARHGPQSPTILARRMGIHPATMTGVLARLEKTGWVRRHRGTVDRRSVQVESCGFDRLADLYSDANTRLDQICQGLSPEIAAAIGDYLTRARHAVAEAAQQITTDGPTP